MRSILKQNRQWCKEMDLEQVIEEISIMDANEVPLPNIKGWFAVADTIGINAYFSTEQEALAYRLFLINRILNG